MKSYIFFSPSLIDAEHAKPEIMYLIAGPLLYLIAVLLALININFAIAIYLLIPVIYFFAGGIEEKKG